MDDHGLRILANAASGNEAPFFIQVMPANDAGHGRDGDITPQGALNCFAGDARFSNYRVTE